MLRSVSANPVMVDPTGEDDDLGRRPLAPREWFLHHPAWLSCSRTLATSHVASAFSRRPRRPFARRSGGRVEIKGHIAPSEEGLVVAPFSGREVVWARVTVERVTGGRHRAQIRRWS